MRHTPPIRSRKSKIVASSNKIAQKNDQVRVQGAIYFCENFRQYFERIGFLIFRMI